MSVNPEAIDPVAVADQVGKTPDAELEAGMRSEGRSPTVDGELTLAARLPVLFVLPRAAT